MSHTCTEDRSDETKIVVNCTCGWTKTFGRRQNTTAKTEAKAHCKGLAAAEVPGLPPSPVPSQAKSEWPRPDADYKVVGTEYDEREMKDYEYMFGDYWYVVDVKVVRPEFTGQVSAFKKQTGAKIVWLCDQAARGLKPRVR